MELWGRQQSNRANVNANANANANACSDVDHPFGNEPELRFTGRNIPPIRHGQRPERLDDEWCQCDVEFIEPGSCDRISQRTRDSYFRR